jgi:hypothetical protein
MVNSGMLNSIVARVLQKHGVTVYTRAPSAGRMLLEAAARD